jgi:hypothetical protein
MKTAPIVLFCFNRPEHLRKTVEALQKNSLSSVSDLYIFSDGPRNQRDVHKVAAVREYLHGLSGFRTIRITEKQQNVGLANSVIAGVTEILQKHGRVIVMEDDLVCTTDFLDYMNKMLEEYKDAPSIFSVTGYLFPIEVPKTYHLDVCSLPRASSWGWGTWLNRWEKANFNVPDFAEFMQNPAAKKSFMQGGEDMLPMLVKQRLGMIDSWAIRWCYTHFKYQANCLYPVRSKIQSIGIDGQGTNVRFTNRFKTYMYDGTVTMPAETSLKVDATIQKGLQTFFRLTPQRRIINYFKVFRRWEVQYRKKEKMQPAFLPQPDLM